MNFFYTSLLVLLIAVFKWFYKFLLIQRDDGDEELCSVFVPTNHLYLGDILLVNSKDVIRPNLSIREGIGMLFTC